ncbi:RSP_7527 family protein [Sediminicurvatus halobius]|uniref:Uncharacterized protein n=1 Tax=Sediminicurvatus halobius TaxID=2182432 RepID=A0A2U2N4N5_9GAMM|nr:hypothetical protein [Spiribacter halobius]PWG64042.1 hypothetical protein DEM34_05945 [Spiribacter halobius]UEX76903.1 hypothetical protein LMH63_13175 [Spiribacter halobius]
MPDRDNTGAPLPDADPEPEEQLDAFTVEQEARRLRAQTLRQLFLSLFRRRRDARPLPAQPTRATATAAVDEEQRKAA